MIVDYNKSKGGVDTLDQLVRTYSSKRKTNRWPFAIFCNLLDICCYNAFIVFLHSNPDFQHGKSHKRRLFILEMSKSLLPCREIEPITQPGCAPSETKYTRCKFCPRQRDKKTKERCLSCKIPICKEHTITICANCNHATSTNWCVMSTSPVFDISHSICSNFLEQRSSSFTKNETLFAASVN